MQDYKERLKQIDLRISPNQQADVDTFLQVAESSISSSELLAKFQKKYISVTDGEILVYHHVPRKPKAVRPVVLVPGWGASLESFFEFYVSIIDQVECYHIETREKRSSRLTGKNACMSVEQSAADIQQVLSQLITKNSPDCILAGTCWGSSVILQGLIKKSIVPKATFVLFDPMHTLWFPKFLLNSIVPFIPIWLAEVIKPFGKWLALSGMKEQVQRQRTGSFIDDADLWKWKQASLQAKDFELLGNLAAVEPEVFILNGTKDKIHDQRFYPLIAHEIPRGRFIYMKTDESKRERLIGKVCREFARVSATAGLPEILQQYERDFDSIAASKRHPS